MKEYLRHLIDDTDGDLQKVCLVREYLQARLLKNLQEAGAFTRWAFLGGTALRFLYSIPRYSEDLDFSSVMPVNTDAFQNTVRRLRTAFEAEGYSLTVTVKSEKNVQSAFIKFAGLLYDLELSSHQTHVLSIKIEVDTNPPAGARTESTLIRRHVTLNLHHYDRASLFAGKIHAVLSRPWVKGRDLYDIIWYLADRNWPEPNLPFLRSALVQTGWSGSEITPDTWREVVKDRLLSVDLEKARSDVLPFLEKEGDVDLLTVENIRRLLDE